MQVPQDPYDSRTASTVPVLDPAHQLPAQASPDGDGGQPPKNMWTRFAVLGVLLAGAGWFVAHRIAGNQKSTKSEASRQNAFSNRPTPVAVKKIALENVPVYLTALGTVTAYNTVTVKSRVDGQINRVLFTEGQHVNQGQTLLQIDPSPYQAALAQAKGNLERDKANAALADAQSQRYTALYQAGVVSRESAQTQQSTAGQSVGTLAGDQAAIQAAQVNLNYTRITSPISGIVGLRQVDVGNIVAANSTTGLVVITQVQPIAVIFTLPEEGLQQARAHMKQGILQVEAWDSANTKKIATGQLLTIDNQIDPSTGTVKLKAVFPNADESLFPNQFVNVRLILVTRPNSLVVPAPAVQTGQNDVKFVYVVDTSKPVPEDATEEASSKKKSNGSSDATAGHAPQPAYLVHATPVDIDVTQGTQVILKNNGKIKPGELVVIDGQEKLKDNSKVNLRTDAGQPIATDGKGGHKASRGAAKGDGSKAGDAAQQTNQGASTE